MTKSVFEWPRPVVYGQTDDLPILRVRCGRGFAYRDRDGSAIRDRQERRRFAALAIPPAWEDVRIAADGKRHVQAVGRDARKRKQYRYHPLWIEQNKRRDFERLADFARALPKIRAFIDAQLRRQALDRERMTGIALHLLDRTLIRIGNEAYAEANGSYGLTTLTNEHVTANGNVVSFRFIAKGGKLTEIDLHDPRAARAVKRCHELPGQRLLQYVADDGEICPLTSTDVNEALQEITGQPFTAKTFRTWGGTVDAFERLVAEPLPAAVAEQARTLNRHLRESAAVLGNTLAVCRKYYVHPKVVAAWQAGELAELPARVRARQGLDEAETATLRFLESQAPRRA
jgi:DNA topoisomerase IB